MIHHLKANLVLTTISNREYLNSQRKPKDGQEPLEGELGALPMRYNSMLKTPGTAFLLSPSSPGQMKPSLFNSGCLGSSG
mmetsp:Transcript_1305/g.1936  ORF Transcript_1305/g.1936 Transcript_1305/m.1936 type:complete len:80 (+) Transcript_1305:173-412(+)